MAHEQGKSKGLGRGGNPPPKHGQWKPGQSGNPKGRPRGSGITDRLRKLVNEDNDGRIAEALAKSAAQAALRGDFRFFKEIIDRLDGPVKQQIETETTAMLKIVRAEDAALLDTADTGQGAAADEGDSDAEEDQAG